MAPYPLIYDWNHDAAALHGAGHKDRPAVVQLLVDDGARLDIRNSGNTDNRGGKLAVHT